MTSKYVWQYYLIVPVSQVPAADAVAPALNNPDGVEATFTPFPENSDGDATHYIASFIATENTIDGVPSKELLENALSDNPALANIKWVRCLNPEHPATPANKKNVVVDSNWALFPADSAVSWPAIAAAIPLP